MSIGFVDMYRVQSSRSAPFLNALRNPRFQELSEHLGLRQLNARLTDPLHAADVEGIFPRDTPKNTRFSINFFTSIGLGGLTDGLREHLKNMPKQIMQQQPPPQVRGPPPAGTPSSLSSFRWCSCLPATKGSLFGNNRN